MGASWLREENFGTLFKQDFHPYRDELIISTKAGYDMWPGPYGEWGSRKYLLASLDQSLKRMGLEYVDIFYIIARPRHAARRDDGRARFRCQTGQSFICRHLQLQSRNDAARFANLKESRNAVFDPSAALQHVGSLVEDGLLDVLNEQGIGCIVFSPLAQGQLTDRYLNGIPSGARATKTERVWLTPDDVKKNLPKTQKAERTCQEARTIAGADGARLGASPTAVTSALIGASSVNNWKIISPR